jgi:hypothetical protein
MLSSTKRLTYLAIKTWTSTNFFPAEGKIFQAVQKHNICLKNTKYVTKFSKNTKNIIFLASRGAGGQEPLFAPTPLLLTQMHKNMCLKIVKT